MAPPRRPVDEATLLEQIIQCSPIGMAVVDAEGLLRAVNPAYCALHGRCEEDLLGQPFTLVFPAAQQDAMRLRHRRFLDEGGEFKGEWQVVRRDGAVLDVRSESVRVPGADGRTHRLVYVLDITERKHMEQALQATQQFLRSVLDGLTAHVCVLDDAGTVVAVNQAWREFAAANGGAAGTGEGANYLQVCDAAALASGEGSEAGPFAAMLREVLEGKRLRFELEYPCHPPGGQRWFLARVSRIEGSRPAQVVVAHDDVTPLQQAKETLRRSEGLLLDLAASIPGALFRMARRCGGHWGFVYVSPGIETLYEVSPERACRDPAALRDCVLAEDLPGLYAAIRQAHSEGNALELEFRILTRSGQVKWIQAKARLKPGEDDQPMWTGVLTDISERKQMETALRDNEQTYRTLFETVPQGVIYQDAQGRITSGNPAASRILGLTLDQLQGRTSVDPRWRALHEDGSLFAGEDHPAMVALRTGRPVNGVVMGVAVPDRGYVWINVNATPLFGHGRLEQVYTTFEDITQRVLLSHELRQQASTDYLTGVANRRSLMERLNTEYRRIQRHPEVQCSVLALDLDHFKRVNDTWGHAAGDAMLVHLARLMRKGKRELDMVARSGGEEFTLLLPDTATDEAQAFADRLRRRVEDTPLQRGEHRIGITVSIGVSAMRSCDASADAVLVRADSALYEAKNAGRNAVRLS